MAGEAVNLINSASVGHYLQTFSEGFSEASKLAGYLACALEKPLRRDGRFVRPVKGLPEGAPAWLRKKWGKAQFHEFVPDPELDRMIAHICDWIKASIARGESWLDHVDAQGRPLKLLKIGSLEQALIEAEKDRAVQRQKQTLEFQNDSTLDFELKHGDVEIVKRFEDGYIVVRILTKVAAARESYLMQNCIGDGAYDEILAQKDEPSSLFYSLRDPQNKSHATIEVRSADRKVYQCVGKQNRPVVDKYVGRLIDFFTEFGFECGHRITSCQGYVFHEGKTYFLDQLPDNFVFDGDLWIEGYIDFKCPKNLKVTGSLFMDTMQRPFLRPDLVVGMFIYERFQVTHDVTKVLVHKREFGKIWAEEWRKKLPDSGYVLHREGGPAVTDFATMSGRVLAEKWYSFGKLHRAEGSAVERWDSITGAKISSARYVNGQFVPEDTKVAEA